MTTTPFWADNPTAEDLLSFSDIAEPIVEALDRDHLDPVAIGVMGDWGCGKTTVLELISKTLADREDVVVVTTRPWEYDPATDPKATLIAEVLTAVHAKAIELLPEEEQLDDRIRDKFKALAKRIQWSKAISLGARAAIGFNLPSFDDLLDVFDDGSGDDEDGGDGAPPADPTLHGFREEFQSVMADLDGIRRVVVLVDDLDRCLPATVVDALEAVKLFLSVPKMGFVIAADRRLVAISIADRYRPAPQADEMALQYLEKIIQIPIAVPSLSESETEAYLALLLLQRHLPGAADKIVQVIAHCEEQRQKAAQRILDDLPADCLPEGGTVDLALAAQLTPVLHGRTAGNPRRLKRFLNSFWIRSSIASRRGIDLAPGVLAKLMVLEEHDPKQFSTLIEWLNAGELASRLRGLEVDEAPVPDEHAVLRVWANAEPKLADQELTPYVRLAAALASKAVGGLALRSDLRKVLDGLTDGSKAQRKIALEQAAALPLDDRMSLAGQVVEMMRADPEKQGDLAEALAGLAEDDNVAADVISRLRELDPAAVASGTVIRLARLIQHDTWRQTLEGWQASEQLGAQAANAVKNALNPKPKRRGTP